MFEKSNTSPKPNLLQIILQNQQRGNKYETFEKQSPSYEFIIKINPTKNKTNHKNKGIDYQKRSMTLRYYIKFF